MIEAVRSWLIAVAAAAFLVSLSQSLIPEGTVRKIASFTGGLILLLVMVKPLLGADFERLDLRYEDYAAAVSYTHLDVYKRQALDKATKLYVLGQNPVNSKEIYDDIIYPAFIKLDAMFERTKKMRIFKALGELAIISSTVTLGVMTSAIPANPIEMCIRDRRRIRGATEDTTTED